LVQLTGSTKAVNRLSKFDEGDSSQKGRETEQAVFHFSLVPLPLALTPTKPPATQPILLRD